MMNPNVSLSILLCLPFLPTCSTPDVDANLPDRHLSTQTCLIPYGAEFWREALVDEQAGISGEIDISGTIDRVSHAIEVIESYRGSVRARNYRAEFDGYGLRFSPRVPADLVKTEFTFRTLEVYREGGLFYSDESSPLEWTFLGNTAQVVLDEVTGLVEHHESRAAGVEVTWVLSESPSGSGPLQVEAEVGGLAYTRTTETGHHFVDASGNSKVRVSRVTAVDSIGARWELPSAVEKGVLQVSVPADLLEQAVYPLAIDPWIGPEFDVGGPVTGYPSPQTPCVASNGEVFLVIWVDEPDGRSPVHACRIREADGAILDVDGMLLAEAGEEPSVVSDGADFLVAFAGEQPGQPGQFGIIGMRIRGTDGVNLDPDGIYLADGYDETSAASNGELYFVAWSNFTNVSSIHGVRLRSSDGVVLDPDGVVIASGTGGQAAPKAASARGDFFVIWYYRIDDHQNEYRVAGARVQSEDGVVLDPGGMPLGTAEDNQFYPKVLPFDGDYLAVWAQETPDGSDTEIRGARVDPADGTVIDAEPLLLATGFGGSFFPDVATNGRTLLLTWVELVSGAEQEIRGTLLSTDTLEAEDPAGWLIREANVHMYDLAAGSSRLLVAYQAVDGDAAGIKARFLDDSCLIDGEVFEAGEQNPDNPCLECIPGVSPTEWSPDDTNSCAGVNFCMHDQVCEDGVCVGGTQRDCGDIIQDPVCQGAMCNEDEDSCVAVSANEGGSCDDGFYCTAGDTCQNGVCVGGPPHDCGDVIQDPACQGAVCDEDEDICVAIPENEGGSCDDGSFCTVDESCQAGVCVSGSSRDCQAAVQTPECQSARCDEVQDRCLADPVNEGGACDDGWFCTVGDACRAGSCLGGETRDCEAEIEITSCQYATCNESLGTCEAVPAQDDKSCDDGDLCTQNDSCLNGQCQGGQDVCTSGGGGCSCGAEQSAGSFPVFGLLCVLGCLLRRRKTDSGS